VSLADNKITDEKAKVKIADGQILKIGKRIVVKLQIGS